MSEPDLPVYSIGAAARMVDVTVATLRAWEERYSVITPIRSGGAQRLYSRGQIEQLKYIKAQMDAGMSAADAHRLLSQRLQTGGLPAAPKASFAESGPLVLIADRDSYAADLAEYFLRTEGYQVSIATDAVQARLLFSERGPNLVIVDLLISGGAGFRLCGDLAAAGAAQVLAVAAIDAGEEAMALGAAAFLHKPLDPLVLASTVKDLLGTSALALKAAKARR
jgi:DNA-binding transcriptional MerR regulator